MPNALSLITFHSWLQTASKPWPLPSRKADKIWTIYVFFMCQVERYKYNNHPKEGVYKFTPFQNITHHGKTFFAEIWCHHNSSELMGRTPASVGVMSINSLIPLVLHNSAEVDKKAREFFMRINACNMWIYTERPNPTLILHRNQHFGIFWDAPRQQPSLTICHQPVNETSTRLEGSSIYSAMKVLEHE